MRLDNKGFNLVEVAAALLICGLLWGNLHLDPAEDSARLESETLDVTRFDAVDLEAISGNNNISVSFSDENGNSYSAVKGGVSVTFESDSRDAIGAR